MTLEGSAQTQLVSRAEWGARRPDYITKFTPSFGTTAHWEGPSLPDFEHSACASYVRGIQNFHMDARGWSDIAYTAVVCPHGYVFEGRWLGKRTGANGTNLGNGTAYAVCYLGGVGDEFTSLGDRAMHDTMIHLRRQGGAGAQVNGHRDWKATACPGDEIYRRVTSGRYTSDTPLPSPVPSPAPAPTPEQSGPRMLQEGMRGEDVRQWQTILKGYDNSVTVDGIFGPQTTAVTKRFQSALRITADGIVGPATREATEALFAFLAAQPNINRPTIQLGSRGEHVQYLQSRLHLPSDGIFGPITKRGVVNFQRMLGLVPDGIVGPKTWALVG